MAECGLNCISAAPAALDRYLAAVPAMSLIPLAPLTRDLPIARSPHHATIRQSGSDQSTRRRPRTPRCGLGRAREPNANDCTIYY
jgi:hypothetical protein